KKVAAANTYDELENVIRPALGKHGSWNLTASTLA
ncbi:MAG: hypothetical protein JWO80_4227, partial [Bryobacterales bacterium]|nr:hypothetical protein [Bryobacterales bacterium]